MRERATLRLDDGDELRVELDRDDLSHPTIVVSRVADDDPVTGRDLISVLDEHLAVAVRHPAGTTERLLKADRDRPS